MHMGTVPAVWGRRGVCVTLFCVLSGCGVKHTARDKNITWDEIVGADHAALRPNSPSADQEERAVPQKEFSGQSTSGLSPYLQRLADAYRIAKPSAYAGGVYGKVGEVVVFAAHQNQVPDFDRLYWVMVKVLSEKYGCFIIRKLSTTSKVSVQCRDLRWVVFLRGKASGGRLHFYARQYDEQGRQLVVRNHKIVQRL